MSKRIVCFGASMWGSSALMVCHGAYPTAAYACGETVGFLLRRGVCRVGTFGQVATVVQRESARTVLGFWLLWYTGLFTLFFAQQCGKKHKSFLCLWAAVVCNGVCGNLLFYIFKGSAWFVDTSAHSLLLSSSAWSVETRAYSLL